MAYPAYQGLDGPVVFSGSTPELDDFIIRVVEGETHSAVLDHQSIQ